jgi:hypothetical protein
MPGPIRRSRCNFRPTRTAAKPTIPVGGIPVDRRVLEVLKPDDVLAIAEHAIHGRGDGKVAATLEQLNPFCRWKACARS